MVNVTTYLNSLKTEGKKYCFRSNIDQLLDSERLIKEIISYNSTITEADARAVLSVLNDRVKHFVNLGYKVELPFGFAYLKAKGTADRLIDSFTPGTGNHKITVAFMYKQDAATEMTKDAAYRLVGAGYVSNPVITIINSVTDSGKEGEALTFKNGDMLRVKGRYLSFAIEDERQGVFLVAKNKSEIRLTRYNRTGTNIVDAYIPADIAVGDYGVSLVTKPGAGRYEQYTYSTKIAVAA